jgi:hypothetical protein
MALKLKKITLKNGIEINEPYFKITLVSYNDEYKEISYAGAVYYSRETREKNLVPIEELRVSGNYPFYDKMANYYEEIYRHIKEEAKKVRHMTKEQIFQHNEEKYIEASKTMAPPEDIIDVNNLLFVDAEDC